MTLVIYSNLKMRNIRNKRNIDGHDGEYIDTWFWIVSEGNGDEEGRLYYV